MPRKSLDYLSRFKKISPYVSFSYSKRTLTTKRLTRKQKLKITKYFKEISALKNRPHKIYRPQSKEKLIAAQSYSGQISKRFPALKVAFVPVATSKAKIKYTKGKIQVKDSYVTTTELLFELKPLLANPSGYTKKKIKSLKAKNFNIMAGKYEIAAGYNKTALPGAVERLVNNYGARTVFVRGEKRLNNHYVGNWLFGVRAHTFSKQASFVKFDRAKTRAIVAGKRARRRKRGKNEK